MRTALLAAAVCVSAIGVAAGQATKPASTALPDWSGVWQMVGPTVFDRASVQPQNGRAGDPGVREFPPLTDEYEAIYRKNIDRTGLVLSDAARVTTRLRKINDTMLEAAMVVDDAKALKAAWKVTKQYRKLPAGTWAWDYGCAENNRNPISGSGKTLTLGPNGKPLDKKVD